ncbi:2-oxo-4-hydroxy-4-carboxy-5-ureidoimidazoline decarboxylase [Aestuariivirga litoralis]|uniref:2-oxo-4-hydroxy-4-carboxy-5-ureidoimidazoline decarboxylase n=1 Tax=Aestuariivirga litoralis TaxID=2650924 RepID=A0A2W2BDA3_9HYPH|nr:2-oxo-4-hydroxy-4-carboxy-5-ureidoimidazoline decarboxylase [Aestuariivirga litoralis]PZF78214.1 2-oxo-4-hydroxy-4-carboxy-5-ureidoimidazoline decarboxylase [Aestuariivirga litoralis]
MISIADVNAMSPKAFIETFGDVAEHSPWVAREADAFRPFASREALVRQFETAIRGANRDAQLALVRAHPDLAGRAKLTDDSTKEQAGAGLNTLTADEFARFTDLNTRYRERFGFPFIFAVKGATKHMILDSFAARVGNDRDAEFETALQQVCRIFRLRLEDRVSP